MDELLPYLLDFEREITESSDPKNAKVFWAKLAWEVQSCAEAAELFPDMLICPICFERESEGVVAHKYWAEVLN